MAFKHLLFTLVISASAFSFDSISSLNESTNYSTPSVNYSVGNSCKYTDLNSLKLFLSKSAKDYSVAWSYQSDTLFSNSNVYYEIDKCSNAISSFGMQACFNNLKNYSYRKTSDFSYKHLLGFNQNDSEYLSTRMNYFVLPKELSNGLPEDWKGVASKKGWKVLDYRSRVLPNPPHNQYSRILFYIPGEEFDQWIQFTSPDIEDEEFKQSTLIDMIAVLKVKNGMTLDKPQINFIQYQRDVKGKNPQVRSFFDRCIRCHPSGLRHINPMIGSLSDEESLKTAAEYNKIISNYGEISWGGSLNPEKISPAFGKKDNTCFECHNNYQVNDGTAKGILTAFSDRNHFSHKMTVEFSMHPELKKNPEYKDFFDAIKKLRVLSKDQQKELFKISKVPDNGTLLKFAADKGLISASELQKAYQQYNLLLGKQTQTLNQLNTEFEKDLEFWLKGENENCTNN